MSKKALACLQDSYCLQWTEHGFAFPWPTISLTPAEIKPPSCFHDPETALTLSSDIESFNFAYSQGYHSKGQPGSG